MKLIDRFNDLSFVIGTFFTIIAIVLFANIFIMMLSDSISIYTAVTFLIFGLLMMFAGKKKS